MAYSTGCSTAPRVNVFSNPDLRYAGSPQGSEKADNARVLNEAMVSTLRLSRRASFRGDGDMDAGRHGLNSICQEDILGEDIRVCEQPWILNYSAFRSRRVFSKYPSFDAAIVLNLGLQPEYFTQFAVGLLPNFVWA